MKIDSKLIIAIFSVFFGVICCSSKKTHSAGVIAVDQSIEKVYVENAHLNAIVIYKFHENQLVIIATHGKKTSVNELLNRIMSVKVATSDLDNLYKNEGKVEWVSTDATGYHKNCKGEYTISETIPVIDDVLQTSVEGFDDSHELKLSRLMRELDRFYQ